MYKKEFFRIQVTEQGAMALGRRPLGSLGFTTNKQRTNNETREQTIHKGKEGGLPAPDIQSARSDERNETKRCPAWSHSPQAQMKRTIFEYNRQSKVLWPSAPAPCGIHEILTDSSSYSTGKPFKQEAVNINRGQSQYNMKWPKPIKYEGPKPIK